MSRWEEWAASMGTWIISLRREVLECAPADRPSIEASLQSLAGFEVVERSARALAVKCTTDVRDRIEAAVSDFASVRPYAGLRLLPDNDFRL